MASRYEADHRHPDRVGRAKAMSQIIKDLVKERVKQHDLHVEETQKLLRRGRYALPPHQVTERHQSSGGRS